MRNFVFFSVILLTSLSVSAQTKSVPVKKTHGPEIQFSATSHNFGNIDEGSKAKYDFEFTNTGDTNLILIDVQAVCGCTVPTWPRQPIKPGEKSKISVVFNSAGRAGEKFHKSITVTTNMKQDNVKIIFIEGFVGPKISPENQTIPYRINQNQ
jgi:hypothetical protein